MRHPSASLRSAQDDEFGEGFKLVQRNFESMTALRSD